MLQIRRISAGALSLGAAVVFASGAPAKGRPGSDAGADRCGHDDALSALIVSPMCFPEFMTREEMLDAVRRFGLLPPAHVVQPGDPRYFHDAWVWGLGIGHVPTVPAGTAAPAILSISFPDDGATWGLASIDPASVQANTLSASFAIHLGDVDRGRELTRQAFASWSRFIGVRYHEIADDQSPMDQNPAYVSWRGDIRIGGGPVPGSPYVAYNAFPSSASGPGFVGGGDMFIDTTAFNIGGFNNPSNNYRFFRNVVAHEHGHGLGLYHAVPCNQTKLMEPQVATTFDGPTPDELRGAARNHNDPYAPNHTLSDAHWLGDLVPVVHVPPPGSPPVPMPRSFGARNLSLNGVAGANGTGTDWFLFETSAAVPSFAAVVGPTGGTYDTGVQSGGGCAGTVTTIAADAVGDLELELMDLNSGVSWIASVNGPGAAETIIVPNLPAGAYALRISDIGPTAPDHVQLYNLSILVGTPTPPAAVPGIDKRCRANAPCWFMGDINSYTTDPNAFIIGYEWDLDGDGFFETVGPAQIPFIYPSSGQFNAGLRVIDSNGMIDESRIRVTTHGATTSLTGVTPGFGYQGRNANLQLTGANFLIPTTLQASGVGIQVVAFGATNALGTQAGAFLFIDPSTPLGFYDLRVTNAEGADTLIGQFQVRCVGDLDGDNLIGFGDLNILLGVYNQVIPGHPADFDQNGVIDFADLNFLLGRYNQPC